MTTHVPEREASETPRQPASATRQSAPEPPTPPAETGTNELIQFGAAARLLRPVRVHLIACAVISAVAVAAGFAPYVAIAQIAAAVLTPGVESLSTVVWTWVVIGVVGALVRLALLALSAYVGHQADARILHHLRQRIVSRLGVVPLGWFRSAGSGQVKKAMTTDLEEMHHLIAHALGEVVGGVTALVVGFGYLVFVDWRMALVTVSVLLLMAISFQVAMRSSSTHLARLAAAEGRISTTAVEYLDGIAVAKTFGAGGLILDRFNEAVRVQATTMSAWVNETRYSAALNRLLGSEMTVLGVVVAAGLGFVSAGWITMAGLIPFLVVGVGLPTSIMPIIHGAQGLRKARMAAGRIEQLLNKKPLPEPTDPREPIGNHVEFDRVTFSYDGVTDAISELTVSCAPGTVTALVGPSGAGKSTVANLLPRFYDVTSGEIRVGGVDVRQIDPATLLSSIALVFQDVMLLRDTVTENLRLGRPDATDEQVRAAARAARVHEVIERLPQGYDTVLGSDGAGLSGGERQRLTIARAILSDAPIVVLDEATAALDPDNESAVQAALSELVVGRTVLVIAHRLHTIAGADQIVVLDGGRLAEAGTHDELLAHEGLYSRMWRAQRNGVHA